MKAPVFTTKGTKTKTQVTLPEAVFGAAWKPDLVHAVVVAMQGNARAGTAHTKDRSEVAGGGKKPWRQKGTGRARHGSRRSPIWTGGGVTFGPRNEKDYSRKINKKMRTGALVSVLSKKYADGEVLFLDALELTEPKTATARELIAAVATGADAPRLTTKKTNAAIIVLPERNEVIEKSFRNFGNIEVAQAKDISPVDVLSYTYLVFVHPDTTVATLESRVTGATKVTA